MKKRNVFSDPPEEISMLVFTQSFLSNTEAFVYFNNANLLRRIKIYYMPLSTKANETLPIEMGTYHHKKEETAICTSIEYSNCSGLICVSRATSQVKPDIELDAFAEEIILRDKSHSQLFDYVVASDRWCDEHKDYDSVICYSDAKEILRLFLINKKEFELTPHFTCDETLCYIYRHNILFQEFQNFWVSTIENNKEIDTASALNNRLLLFSICIDNARTEAYKIQNNTTAMYLKYHISYLLLLITGAFDSLAWLINNLYKLGLENVDRLKIDLLKKDFRKAVRQKSPILHDILLNGTFLSQVKAIRELRDRIVHRDFIEMISNGTGQNRIDYLWVDKIASEKLLDAGFKQEWIPISISDECAIDIKYLLKYLEKVTIDIVNRFLKHISDEIYHSNDQYLMWKILNFPEKPYVL